MIYLYTFILWSPLALLLVYSVAVQADRTPEQIYSWLLPVWPALKLLCQIVGVFGFVLDVVMQYTVANIYFWQMSQRGEFTISMRLERLVSNTGWRGALANWLARLLNRIAPKKHIQNFNPETP